VAAVVYLDSSALVKLVLAEPESAPLRRYLAEGRLRAVSSILAAVEVPRAVRRAEPAETERAAERAAAVVAETVLLELTLELAQRAALAAPAELHSADAVHLVSAVSLGSELSAFVVYDRRLTEAARRENLPVVSPGVG